MFSRENPQNSEPQNGPRSGLDYIALSPGTSTIVKTDDLSKDFLRYGRNTQLGKQNMMYT
jgi:hypothetical protein